MWLQSIAERPLDGGRGDVISQGLQMQSLNCPLSHGLCYDLIGQQNQPCGMIHQTTIQYMSLIETSSSIVHSPSP